MKGILTAIIAAILYGASFPLTKGILDENVNPFILAGLFYLSQAVVFLAATLVRKIPAERKLHGADWKWMAGSCIFGGFIGPIMFLKGQESVAAYVASLLSPTEILFTTVIAFAFFKERLSRSDYIAVFSIMAGSILVGFASRDNADGTIFGAILVAASFLMWGIDNNCTTKISERDPFLILFIKGIVGGTFNFGAGLWSGASIPRDAAMLGLIAAVGIVCYGCSMLLFIYSMRTMGASRSVALFGTNPIFAVFLAWLMRGEIPTVVAISGGIIMAAGVYMLSIRNAHKNSAL